MNLIICLISFFLLPAQAWADAPETRWEKVIGDATHLEVCYDIQSTQDGGFILSGRIKGPHAGEYSDCYLVKLNSDGNVVWDKSFDIGFNGHVRGNSVTATRDGGFIVAGWADVSGGHTDAYLLKTNAQGARQWQHTYGGNGDDVFNSVLQTPDGGYLAAGRTDSWGSGSSYAYVLRADAAGNIVWHKYYGGSGNEYAENIIQTGDNGFIFTGSSSSPPIDDEAVYVVKIYGNGNIDWYHSYEFAEYGSESGESIQQTSDGGYIVAGSYESGADPGVAMILKIGAHGSVQWYKNYNWGSRDIFSSVRCMPDGGFVTCGRTNSFGHGGYDLWAYGMDASGKSLWNLTFGGSDYDAGYAMDITLDGGIVLAGESSNLRTGGTNIYAIRLAGQGNPQLNFHLNLNKGTFHAGDRFLLKADIRNTSATEFHADMFIVLDVYENYYFWPSWQYAVPDWQLTTISPGSHTTPVILDFTWPEVSGSASDLRFWGALLDPNSSELLCDVDMVTFGY